MLVQPARFVICLHHRQSSTTPSRTALLPHSGSTQIRTSALYMNVPSHTVCTPSPAATCVPLYDCVTSFYQWGVFCIASALHYLVSAVLCSLIARTIELAPLHRQWNKARRATAYSVYCTKPKHDVESRPENLWCAYRCLQSMGQ